MNPVRSILVAALLSAWTPLAAQQPADTGARAATTADSRAVVTPAADQARGIDAELRAALFDLTAGRPLAALDRLEWLRGATRGGAATAAQASPRASADLLFLLAESYYRLGMGDSFRATARELAATPEGARYAGVIAAQRMLDAYRRGDDSTVRALAAQPTSGGDRPLAALVGGLSAYRAGDFASARASFAATRAAGGVLAPYAQYMQALSVLQGDTTRAALALDSLRPLAAMATGEFGDHVRLMAAELAYQSGQYDAAARYADGVLPASGLGAQALLVKAWALYRAGQLDQAEQAFAAFTTRYRQLPSRDEARVMVGQVMLESGKTAEAERYFQTLADSIGGEVAALQARAAGALTDAARAIVTARAAGIAFLDDPVDGKTVALPDAAGADASTVLAAFDGAPAPPVRAAPHVVSLAEVESRVDTLAPALGAGFPRRLLYTPVSAPAVASRYAERAATLLDADMAAALARYRLQEALDAHGASIAALEELQRMIGRGDSSLARDAQTLAATRDSLTAMRAVLDRSRVRVREALTTQLDATRRMAAENLRLIDSTRAALGAIVGSKESEILDTERSSATTFARVAEQVQAGLDGAIDRHPVFALRDSLGARLARAETLHDETQRVLASDADAVSGALAALHGAEPERTRTLRAALATAEARRAAAESQVVSLLDAELRARAATVLATLGHSREAADYGSASAAFFRATESRDSTSAAPGTTGAADAPAGADAGAPATRQGASTTPARTGGRP